MADKDPTDLDIEQTEESEEDEALPAPRYEIFSYPADTTLKGYLDQWNAQQLFIPKFQRNFVWDQTRASKLVESFLLGLPVPPVFLFKPARGQEFWIIDGQQRIMSVVYFQQGTFRDKKFRLTGVDRRWEGKTFEELEKPDKFAIETAVLPALQYGGHHPTNMKSDIASLVSMLNEDAKNRFDSAIRPTDVSAYSNVITARHNIGHKQGAQITLGELENGITAAEKILVAVHDCLE